MKASSGHMTLLIITMVITLLPMVIGLCTWSKLPESVAIHFGPDGKPNGWAPKWVAVILLPLMLAAVQVVVYFSLNAPLAKGSIGAGVYNSILLIVPLCSIICAIAIYGKALK